MKSSTLLDSVVFQLTPTRTRCDLIINSNGKSEKIASGLLSPFLAHLKSAQEEMAKGGYSIVLEPGPSGQASWFTKGTVERFVRFVSTPEVLERVYTLESEILQLEEAILIQNKNDNGLTMVEEQPKPVQSIEGSRPILDINDEKAIVLYKPETDPSETNKSTSQEGQTRVQLLKVLETRKKVLQKEQGMAFARATAAGFDMDHMTPLLSFAESFGASRLMEACMSFTELWKRKHETGQWVEIEAAEAISGRSEFSTMYETGVTPDKQRETRSELASENNGRSIDEMPTPDHQASKGQQQFFPGHFPHQMYPPWPVHSPPGTFPMYPAYPVPGTPYYQNHPGNSPYFQSPYISSEDPRLTADVRIRQRRNSMDSRDGNSESETWEVNSRKARSKDDSELYVEATHKGRKKGSRTGKRKSGVVVIRNLNYITSRGQDDDADGTYSQSASGSDIDEDGDIHEISPNMNQKDSLRSSRGKDGHSKSVDASNFPDLGETACGKEDDSGHWQAFQNCLLQGAGEDKQAIDQGIFAMEKAVQGKRKTNKVGDDPLIFDGQNRGSTHDYSAKDIHQLSGNMKCMQSASNDVLLISRRGDQSGYRNSVDSYIDDQTKEMNSKRGAYKSTANDEFMYQKQENQSGFSSSDPLSINGFEHRTHSVDGKLAQNMDDDSYIVPFRSQSLDQVGTDHRNTIDMDSEFPSAKKEEYLPDGPGGSAICEPVDLHLMPERITEKGSMSYDPAFEYDMEVLSEGGAMLAKKNKAALTEQKIISKSDKDRRSKLHPESSDRKKNVGPVRKAKPSKLSPLEEARARAEKLRSFKADLQKMKKEKEDENMKRLEALKLERQKRIAARGTSNPTDSMLRKQQARKQVPAKVSPTAHKGSKFSDTEPGSSSPLQRSIKTHRFTGNNSGGNRLVQSVSSLPKAKKDDNDVKPEPKVSMARIRRLSEPKMSGGNNLVSAGKSIGKEKSADTTSKAKVFSGTESKKISAILKLDQSKAETLSELRIKTPKIKDVSQSKLAGKESLEKVNMTKSSSTIKGTEMNKDVNNIPESGDTDDNPVIEKTVVMLECEKPSLPLLQASKEKTRMQKDNYDDKNDIEDKMVSDYPAIHAPVSPLARVKGDRKPIENELHVQPSTCEVKMSNVENDIPKILSTSVSESPYQAPYARNSSLDDSCTTKSAYSQAPLQNSRVASTGKDTVTVHDSDPEVLKVEKTTEALEKPHAKESPKGLKRILKFGRKNHSSSPNEQSEPDSTSFGGSGAEDNAGTAYSSGEVHMLKNLISQDETPTASTTPKKSSRTFSLLSPFRSKTSAKRPAA